MRRVMALIIGVVAIVWLSGSAAGASTLADCLAQQHVCVSGSGRTLISPGQESQLEREIGQDQRHHHADDRGGESIQELHRQEDPEICFAEWREAAEVKCAQRATQEGSQDE